MFEIRGLIKSFLCRMNIKNRYMKKIIVLPLIFISLFSFAQTSYTLPDDVKKIIFLGNSITYSGAYISYIETYYKLKYPKRKLEFINVGLPSETVSKLSEKNHASGKFPRPKLQDRLSKTLKKIKPDLIFSCYGMNDGIYLPFDDARFEKYKKGILWLDKKAKKEGIPIVYMTPSIYEAKNGGAYANVLDIYADWLLSLVHTNNSVVLDLHGGLKRKIEAIKTINPYYKFTGDGVHPVKQGHWLIANQLLISLGELKQFKTEDKDFLDSSVNAREVFQLVEKKQRIQKDAWLTAIGHKRPNMKVGMLLKDATTEIVKIDAKIEILTED